VGSIVAWGKLNGKIGDFRFAGQQYINAVILIIILGAAWVTYGEAQISGGHG
jgi:NAD(P) transhydrogenase subunit beta